MWQPLGSKSSSVNISPTKNTKKDIHYIPQMDGLIHGARLHYSESTEKNCIYHLTEVPPTRTVTINNAISTYRLYFTLE
jgi:hypothetical protein